MTLATPPRRPAAYFAIALALALAACGKKEGDAPKQGGPGGPQQAMPVTVIPATSRKVPIVLEAVGQAEGSREVQIRARVSGILEKRLYQEGATVFKFAVKSMAEPFGQAATQAPQAIHCAASIDRSD